MNVQKQFSVLIASAIAFSLISQVSVNIYISAIMYTTWILAMGYLIYKNNFKLSMTSFLKIFVLAYATLIFFEMIKLVVFHRDISNVLVIMRIPLFVYVLGVCMTFFINEDTLYKITRYFVVASLLLALYIHITYFPSLSDWYNKWEYVYTSKNSAVQILMISVFLIWFLKKKNTQTIFVVMIKMISSFYLLFVCILLQGRTALVGFLVVIILNLLLEKKGKLWLVIIGAGIAVASSDSLLQLLFHAFQFDKYGDNLNVNNLTSNRWGLYEKAISLFNESPFWGRGAFYVDNFYLSSAVEVGIIGLGLILMILIYRVKKNLTHNKYESVYCEYTWGRWVLLCSAFLFVESLMEAFPPFGPGVCSCMFWLICGYLDKKEDIYFLKSL